MMIIRELLSKSDENGWKNYELATYGDTLVELLGHATVSAYDKDGDEKFTLDLHECELDIYLAAMAVIQDVIEHRVLNPVEQGEPCA
jgi:hypothetical protein